MDKLGLLFDAKQFAVAFGAATVDLSSAATEARPDATVWLEGGAAVAGAGFAWGHGQLNYKRDHHGFSISGLSIADVHAASISATGIVMRLRKLSDFSGTYSGLGAEATAADGGAATYLKNERGVVIKLVARDAGLRFSLSVDGVRVRLRRPDPTQKPVI
jgi:hypothetical protein